jgi:hypothetical protein
MANGYFHWRPHLYVFASKPSSDLQGVGGPTTFRLAVAGSVPDTIATYCCWSFFEAKRQPVLTTESCNEITIDGISL